MEQLSENTAFEKKEFRKGNLNNSRIQRRNAATSYPKATHNGSLRNSRYMKNKKTVSKDKLKRQGESRAPQKKESSSSMEALPGEIA